MLAKVVEPKLNTKEQTIALCRAILDRSRQLEISDPTMADLTGLRPSKWKAIKMGYYPDSFDFHEFTRIHGLVTMFTMAEKTLGSPGRINTWLSCKNIRLDRGKLSPMEAICQEDDLEMVHEILLGGDPNEIIEDEPYSYPTPQASV